MTWVRILSAAEGLEGAFARALAALKVNKWLRLNQCHPPAEHGLLEDLQRQYSVELHRSKISKSTYLFLLVNRG